MSTICLWLLLYWFIVCLSWYISLGDGTWHILAHPQPLWYLAPSYSNYLEYLLYLASDWVESSVYVLTLPRAVCSCLWRDIPVARIIRNPSRLVLYLLFIMQCSRVKYLWGNCFSYIPRLQSFTNRYVIWGCQSALSKLFIYLLFIWTANRDILRPQKIIL